MAKKKKKKLVKNGSKFQPKRSKAFKTNRSKPLSKTAKNRKPRKKAASKKSISKAKKFISRKASNIKRKKAKGIKSKTTKRGATKRRATEKRLFKTFSQRLKTGINKERGVPSSIIKINLKSLTSFQSKVLAIIDMPEDNLKKSFELNFPKEPRGIIVILKIRKPDGEAFYSSEKSPPDFRPTPEEVKKFVAEVIADYNNNMAEKTEQLKEKYDRNIKIWQIEQVGIRFLY